ncbi:MAG: TlpA disulfide reductase family protein [Candidatus Omnitrophica bacterium]|nr:TlpA disulfide reductase family protein [Candidatus Omnitrophota bacterium]
MKKLLLVSFILLISCLAYGQDEHFSALNGVEITLEKITSSPKVVLFLWTTWCPYCRKEIERLSTDFSDTSKNIDFYSVNIGESRATVEQFAKKAKLTAQITEGILLDPSGVLAQKYSVIGIPTFIVLKNGKIVYSDHHLDQEILNNL